MALVKTFGARIAAVCTCVPTRRFDNLTDSDYLFTQGGELQRLYNLGPTFAMSFSYSVF